jgi:hypothetical protein
MILDCPPEAELSKARRPGRPASFLGKRNGDGDVPHLFGVFGEAIECVSALEPLP